MYLPLGGARLSVRPLRVGRARALLNTSRQALRYATVGIASNLVLYFLYLALVAASLGPKSAMSLVYVLGVAGTFVANSRWSFGARQRDVPMLARYMSAYAAGYFLNLILLWALVDRGGLPHAQVQAALILVVAGFLFLLQKFWVFPQNSNRKDN